MPRMLNTPEQDAAIVAALQHKLHPKRLKVSDKFTAYLAFLCGRQEWTKPVVVDMVRTSDDVLVVYQEGVGDYIESAADLRRNLRGMASAGIINDEEVRYLLRRVEEMRR